LVVSIEVAVKCAVVSLYSVVKQRLKCNTGKMCNFQIKVEGAHHVVCMMNISIFITIKTQLLTISVMGKLFWEGAKEKRKKL
jgi:hypothetical protein